MLVRQRARRAHCWGGYWRWFAGPALAQAIQGEKVRLMPGDGGGVAGVRRVLVL